MHYSDSDLLFRVSLRRKAWILHVGEQNCLSLREASPLRNQREQEGARQRVQRMNPVTSPAIRCQRAVRRVVGR